MLLNQCMEWPPRRRKGGAEVAGSRVCRSIQHRSCRARWIMISQVWGRARRIQPRGCTRHCRPMERRVRSFRGVGASIRGALTQNTRRTRSVWNPDQDQWLAPEAANQWSRHACRTYQRNRRRTSSRSTQAWKDFTHSACPPFTKVSSRCRNRKSCTSRKMLLRMMRIGQRATMQMEEATVPTERRRPFPRQYLIISTSNNKPVWKKLRDRPMKIIRMAKILPRTETVPWKRSNQWHLWLR